ncbi:MAG: peptide ABC transporter substrate-binding protein [Candidatus Saccharibacteria bacterium]|nr:peptide ABC transporter substrate-binding protein [Candidatus Saccharibacteria bacterium]
MIDRATKLRLRRKIRRSRRHVEDIGVQAEEHLERHLIRRLGRLYRVRRFVAGWLLLFVLMIGVVIAQVRALSPYYQQTVPTVGGSYTEGVLGAFTNANPLYATGGFDGAVSQLVFSGLLKYDQNNQLTGDLAESWELDESEQSYTVVLKDNLKWQDGEDVTAEDVEFTYQLIQNPDTRSPLFASWQHVELEIQDERTVTFTLPNVLSSFPHSMTNGIVPKHILATVEPSQMRGHAFNTVNPIGSGPFKFDIIEVSGRTPEEREERIRLVPHEQYHDGMPKLQTLTLRAFRSEERLLNSFEEREINAMVGLRTVPDTLAEKIDATEHSIPFTGQIATFFNNNHKYLKNRQVRQALVRAVDTNALIQGLGYPVIGADSPFLREHFAYDPSVTQLNHDKARANKLLSEAGWKRGDDGIRVKDGERLSFRLHAQNSSEFTYVTQTLQTEWRDIGVEVEVHQPSDNEFQSLMALHNYDALLYGISIGVDPDVFAYWHSSQADPRSDTRLNLSEYSSEVADVALEGGRTRIDETLRNAKYEPFLEAWRRDAPALMLYQPRFLYVVRGNLHNFDQKIVNTTSDRYSNVHNWMTRTTKVNK